MIAAEDKPLDYQKIVLIPGAGHEEMNMLKSYLALTWEIWGEEFSKSHGFTSPNQLKMMRDVWDFHKSSAAHRILMKGFLLELIDLWLKENPTGSLDDFLKSSGLLYNCPSPPPPSSTPSSPSSSSISPSFAITKKFLVPLLQQGLNIILFHKGVRKKNFKLAQAARVAFLPMWFTESHPVYRMGVCNFLRDFSLMPDLLKEGISEWMFASKTGTVNRNQGLDFVGEELNRNIIRGVHPCPTLQNVDRISSYL